MAPMARDKESVFAKFSKFIRSKKAANKENIPDHDDDGQHIHHAKMSRHVQFDGSRCGGARSREARAAFSDNDYDNEDEDAYDEEHYGGDSSSIDTLKNIQNPYNVITAPKTTKGPQSCPGGVNMAGGRSRPSKRVARYAAAENNAPFDDQHHHHYHHNPHNRSFQSDFVVAAPSTSGGYRAERAYREKSSRARGRGVYAAADADGGVSGGAYRQYKNEQRRGGGEASRSMRGIPLRDRNALAANISEQSSSTHSWMNEQLYELNKKLYAESKKRKELKEYCKMAVKENDELRADLKRKKALIADLERQLDLFKLGTFYMPNQQQQFAPAQNFDAAAHIGGGAGQGGNVMSEYAASATTGSSSHQQPHNNNQFFHPQQQNQQQRYGEMESDFSLLMDKDTSNNNSNRLATTATDASYRNHHHQQHSSSQQRPNTTTIGTIASSAVGVGGSGESLARQSSSPIGFSDISGGTNTPGDLTTKSCSERASRPRADSEARVALASTAMANFFESGATASLQNSHRAAAAGANGGAYGGAAAQHSVPRRPLHKGAGSLPLGSLDDTGTAAAFRSAHKQQQQMNNQQMFSSVHSAFAHPNFFTTPFGAMRAADAGPATLPLAAAMSDTSAAPLAQNFSVAMSAAHDPNAFRALFANHANASSSHDARQLPALFMGGGGFGGGNDGVHTGSVYANLLAMEGSGGGGSGALNSAFSPGIFNASGDENSDEVRHFRNQHMDSSTQDTDPEELERIKLTLSQESANSSSRTTARLDSDAFTSPEAPEVARRADPAVSRSRFERILDAAGGASSTTASGVDTTLTEDDDYEEVLTTTASLDHEVVHVGGGARARHGDAARLRPCHSTPEIVGGRSAHDNSAPSFSRWRDAFEPKRRDEIAAYGTQSSARVPLASIENTANAFVDKENRPPYAAIHKSWSLTASSDGGVSTRRDDGYSTADTATNTATVR